MSKKDQIQTYINELERLDEILEWDLAEERLKYEANKSNILGQQQALRLAAAKAREMIASEQEGN